jgi:hypothetical protein
MEHSKWYETIKGYYPTFWKLSMVKNAVVKGRITKEEYEEITGEQYED